MHLDRELGRAPHGFNHQRSEREIGDEMAVHHVHLDPVRASGFGLLHLFGQSAHIGRQDRGNYLDPSHCPAAARSINHRAPAIITDGVDFSAGWPGNNAAVWPSSPTPRTTTSNGETAASTSAYSSAASSGPSSAGIR